MTAMAYHEPTSIEEAVELLGSLEDARCLAGGVTLVAMMNARLVAPQGLVSLRRIAELRGIEARPDGWLRLGAMTRHAETAAERRLAGGLAVVRQAAAKIASPPVRNMGTMGGSVAFADPAADYPPALVAAEAEIEVAGAAGRRRIAASDFFTDWYETALQPGELVTAIWLPPAPPGSRGRYAKLVRVEGDYATVSVALVLAVEAGLCRDIRIAIGGCGPTPVRLPAVEEALRDGALDEAAVLAAGAELAEACDPVDDVRASADYRRRVVPRMLASAVREILAEAETAA